MVHIDMLADFKTCPKCDASFKKQYIGGTGVWKTRILCLECFHIRNGVPFATVIAPLVAQQYGITLEQALDRDRASHEEEENLILAQEDSYEEA